MRSNEIVTCHARTIVVLSIAFGLAVAGCTSTRSSVESSLPGQATGNAPSTLTWTASGYNIPPSVPRGPAGSLVAAAHSGPDAELGAADRIRMLYRSSGAPAPKHLVSGMVLIPKGNAPRDGWPVVAWAHGTTGLVAACAPSLVTGLADDPSAVGEVRTMLAHGWAVVATDYPGLGTPGLHPYLIGGKNAEAVVDAVSAAHQLPAVHLAEPWVILGHSEGGQTALFAAQGASRSQLGSFYRGTVALAPASLLEALLPVASSNLDPVDLAYATYALAGLGTVDPSVHLGDVRSTQAAAVLPDLTRGCINEITRHFAALHITTFLKASSTQVAVLAARIGDLADPDRVAARGPILVEQGTADLDVPVGATDVMVTHMCALGDHVEYHHVPGVDHEKLLVTSRHSVTTWIAHRLADRQVPASTCR